MITDFDRKTPFAILEQMLRDDTGKETVLYGFRGDHSRSLEVFAFAQGSNPIDTSNHVRMSFMDDMNDLYQLFHPLNIPPFCTNVGKTVLNDQNGARLMYEDWLLGQCHPMGSSLSGESIPPIVAPTVNTAYIHVVNLKMPKCDSRQIPRFTLYCANSNALREYLADLEGKIPVRYDLSLPEFIYELNTNLKSDDIDCRINAGISSGTAEVMINEFGQRARDAQQKIDLIKPYHGQMKRFVTNARAEYDRFREEQSGRSVVS